MLQPKLEHVEQFLTDECLGPMKIAGRGTNRWSVSINEPWMPDTKMRCKISMTQPSWSSKNIVLFNAYKSTATMGDKYKGVFWNFVALIKGFGGSKEAQHWFTMKYMLRGSDPRELLNLEPKDKADVEEVGTEKWIGFPGYFERLDLEEHKEYVAYLDSRKIPRWRFNDMRIFVDPSERRVVFPVYENERLIFWTGRAIDRTAVLRWKSHHAKTWSYPVWNLDQVDGEGVVLFEAIFDAAMVHNGVAILGASNTSDVVIDKIIAKNFAKITVVMDNDKAGQQSRLRLAEALSVKHNNVWIYDFTNVEQKDFNSMVVDGVDISMSSKIIKYGVKSKLAGKMGIIS